MASSGEKVDDILASLVLDQQTDAPSYALSNFPIEIQKQILKCLDWKDLLNLRATNCNYNNIITNDIHDIWKLRHDAHWPNSKRYRKSTIAKSISVEEWSGISGWLIHIAVVLDSQNWIQEFLRRGRVDQSVMSRLTTLESQIDKSQSTHDVWQSLMTDGIDIVDCIKHIIRKYPTLNTVGSKVLNGISRCRAYQEWRYLHDRDILPSTNVEDGAVVIAKFYDTANVISEQRTLHDWEHDVQNQLDCLAEFVKKNICINKDIEVGSEFQIRDVIEEMKSLFRNSPIFDDIYTFHGNRDDYYNHTNSLINHCMLKTKTGIPIMLAVIYVAIVRRVCGVDMDIIGLPGHIVVGVPYEEGDPVDSRLFVDPFDNGKILSYADCQEIVSRYNMTFNEEMIRPISNEQVWQRMLRNLIHSHSMQALAEDNNDDEESTSDWKIAIPLRFLLSDYESRVRSFRDLVRAAGWCPQFC